MHPLSCVSFVAFKGRIYFMNKSFKHMRDELNGSFFFFFRLYPPNRPHYVCLTLSLKIHQCPSSKMFESDIYFIWKGSSVYLVYSDCLVGGTSNTPTVSSSAGQDPLQRGKTLYKERYYIYFWTKTLGKG